jgi:hypothetical protein
MSVIKLVAIASPFVAAAVTLASMFAASWARTERELEYAERVYTKRLPSR